MYTMYDHRSVLLAATSVQTDLKLTVRLAPPRYKQVLTSDLNWIAVEELKLNYYNKESL